MDSKTLKQPFTATEKAELLALLTQARTMGLKLNVVAAATGIGYKIFTNKLRDLELRVAGKESAVRNSFSHKDYELIKNWWADFKQRMSA